MTDPATVAFRTIASGDAVAEGLVVPFYLKDRKRRVAIARVGGQVRAFDDLCTCAGEACPLSGGLLTLTTILCQCHGSEFDIVSGAVVRGPATRRLDVHAVQETDGVIQVRL
jgi:nitrite reductase/ring-hydroxylating ferredoxin subunit